MNRTRWGTGWLPVAMLVIFSTGLLFPPALWGRAGGGGGYSSSGEAVVTVAEAVVTVAEAVVTAAAASAVMAMVEELVVPLSSAIFW